MTCKITFHCSHKDIKNKKYDKNIAVLSSLRCVKVSKYGVFSGPYLPVLGLNTEKSGSEKTLFLDKFSGNVN